ncbi:MAG TPA: hypothetical protein VMV45_13725, partial [Casimicrobiaceae bacterium]|nr:hypothetical protein [Casimicrobiaceae bacterium]
MTQPATHARIAFELDAREPAQHEIAQVHRVSDGLERQRMLGEPRQQVEARAIAEGQHQVIVGERLLAAQGAAGQRAGNRVDRGDPSHDETRAGGLGDFAQ